MFFSTIRSKEKERKIIKKLIKNNENGVVFFVYKKDDNEIYFKVNGNKDAGPVELKLTKYAVRMLERHFSRFIESLFQAVSDEFTYNYIREIHRRILSYFSSSEQLRLLIDYGETIII